MRRASYRLGVICSSIAMADSIRRVTETSGEDVLISMSVGLDEALPIGKEMEKEGIEVIRHII